MTINGNLRFDKNEQKFYLIVFQTHKYPLMQTKSF
jgi:hypothetical protein